MPLGINAPTGCFIGCVYPNKAAFTTGGPAPGYRDFGRKGWEGITRGIGNGGYSWSLLAGNTNGMLSFDMTWLNSSGSDYRAYGFQLRCLSE
ncbi:hypothetical protein [uncultured Rikenella sp.]|uniref:hypothetical protein n=1 Tax=uncultured Rikenella sp. TaxID=368003 RepID=UPI0025D951B2|nr:hypothetical protein [uncultured Rikenella sp.]